MTANPEGRFISCQQTTELLREEPEFDRFGDRVIEITPDSLTYKDTLINDLGVRVYRLVHGPYLVKDPTAGKTINRHRDIQNLGFLFNVGAVKIFHCGDSSPRCMEDYEHFRLDREGIDVAKQVEDEFPSVTIFESLMDSKTFTLAPDH